MEIIKEGRLTILKGARVVIVTKNGDNLSKPSEDLWNFVDGLVCKGYEIKSTDFQVTIKSVTLVKGLGNS